jgi:hypothetical protein
VLGSRSAARSARRSRRAGERGDGVARLEEWRGDGVDIGVGCAMVGGVAGLAHAVKLGVQVARVGERALHVAGEGLGEQALAPRAAVGEQRLAGGGGVRGVRGRRGLLGRRVGLPSESSRVWPRNLGGA